MRVRVDEERCAGHGVCTITCPEVFTLTEHGYSVADPSEVPAALETKVNEAIANCPEHAIVRID